ncbi:hypothetical protein A0H81_11447 [Grifola frondosa]|uniref:F-box domain-containing protein n=1 Tax=Grifola frondosa TaxID=5627 RepID=A0A1C7LV06_GRIFR|nr:hypothetical protein A0H81_11447 [Grifola frondosa]
MAVHRVPEDMLVPNAHANEEMSTAMRCLCIDEILVVIIEILLARPARSDVISLAGTHRAFRNTSELLLWRTLHSLVPLIKLLENYSPQETEIDGSNGTGGAAKNRAACPEFFSFPPDQDDVDATHFLHFAGFVKEFTWVNENFPILTMVASKWGIIFPNLRRLDFVEDDSSYFEFLGFLPGSNLEHLSVTTTCPDSEVVLGVLDVVRRACGSIQRLEINGLPSLSAISALVQDRPYTREFSGIPLLSRFYNLTEVDITLDLDDGHLDIPSETGDFFSRLKTACFRFSLLNANTRRFLRAITSPELTRLTVTSSQRPHFSIIAAHLDPLRHSPQISRARLAFTLTVIADDWPQEEQDWVDGSALQGVRAPYIETLKLDICWFHWDIAALHDLARAVSEAEVIDLNTELEFARHWFLPIKGLQAFAEHCPHLVRLHVTVWAVNCPYTCPTGLNSASNLEELTVYDSYMGFPEHVAAYLVYLFPKLKHISRTGYYRPIAWDKVSDLLHKYRRR